MVVKFQLCEADEHHGSFKWKKYARGMDGKTADGSELGMLICTLCDNALAVGLTQREAKKKVKQNG